MEAAFSTNAQAVSVWYQPWPCRRNSAWPLACGPQLCLGPGQWERRRRWSSGEKELVSSLQEQELAAGASCNSVHGTVLNIFIGNQLGRMSGRMTKFPSDAKLIKLTQGRH